MDRQGFAILMFIFSGALLLYAGGLALGDASLILRAHAAKMGDRKAYARMLGKILALTALAPLASGIAALLDSDEESIFPVRVLIGGIVLAITLGIFLTRGEGVPEDTEPEKGSAEGGPEEEADKTDELAKNRARYGQNEPHEPPERRKAIKPLKNPKGK